MLGRRARWAASAGALALLVLSCVLLPPVGAAAPGPAHPSVERSEAAFAPTSNISSSIPGPGGTLVPGDRIGYRYMASVPHYAPAWGPITLYFPPTQATFSASTGNVVVPLGARNLTVTSARPAPINLTTVTDPLLNLTVLRDEAPVVFSSLGAAPQAILPRGTFSVAIAWQWIVLAVDGSVTNSSWSPVPPLSVLPAQFAGLVSLGPRVVAPGGNVTACLNGPIGGRAFSLQIVKLVPLDIISSAQAVPGTAYGSDFCWSVPVPSFVLPESADVQVWNLLPGNQSLLLYAQHVRIANTTAPAVGLAVNWTLVANGAAAAGLIALGVYAVAAVWRPRRRPPVPPAGDPGRRP